MSDQPLWLRGVIAAFGVTVLVAFAISAVWQGFTSGRTLATAMGGSLIVVILCGVAAVALVRSIFRNPARPHRRYIRCSSCGNDNRDDDRRCRKCGERITRPSAGT
jgi:hypothetical protein